MIPALVKTEQEPEEPSEPPFKRPHVNSLDSSNLLFNNPAATSGLESAMNQPSEETSLHTPLPQIKPTKTEPPLAPVPRVPAELPSTRFYSGEQQFKEQLGRVLEEVQAVEREIFLDEECLLKSSDAVSSCLSKLRGSFQAVQTISVAHQLCARPSNSFEEKIRLITIDILTNVQSLETVLKSL